VSSSFGSNVFHCCQRYCADVDDVWSVTSAYILQLCKPTDSELLSKAQMLLELVFIRDGCFTFNNSTYFTTSNVNSFIEDISTVRFYNKYIY